MFYSRILAKKLDRRKQLWYKVRVLGASDWGGCGWFVCILCALEMRDGLVDNMSH
jgi:hypothetical protein